MADTLEEIYLGTISPDDLTGGSITIATTGANTRYAIKDVRISNALPDEPITASISVNDVEIASATVSAPILLSGTEIVGANSTVVFSTDLVYPTYYDISYKYYVSPQNYYSQSIAGGSQNSAPATSSYALNSTSYKDIWESDASGVDATYAIFSDGNTSAQFYKNGTLVTSSTYGAYVRTGNDVYELNTANPKIRKYNYVTGVFDLFQNTLNGSLNSSYPRAAAYGDWIFWRWSAQTTIYGININFKSTVQSFTNTFTVTSATTFFGVDYDSATDKFVFLHQDHSATSVKLATTDLTVTELDALGATAGIRTTTDIYIGTPLNNLSSSFWGYLKYIDGALAYPTASLGFGLMDVATGVTSLYIKPTDYPATTNNIGVRSFATITPAAAEAAGLVLPSATIRATGVKSTL